MAELRRMIDAFREVIVELGEKNEGIVVVTGDLASSTGVDEFARLFRAKGRFYDLGVAEEDVLTTAAGLAAFGKPAFATTFAAFGTDLALGQIVQSICANRANVKMVFTHFGVNVGADGGSHQATRAIATLRPVPYLKIAVPADYHETKAVVREAVREPGPVCVLLPREAGEVIYPDDVEFRFGESKVHRFGAKPKILFVACGLMVAEAISAAEVLARDEDLSSRVLNASSIKPLDSTGILEAAQGVEWIFTVEEQSLIGGLGGAVCQVFGGERNHPPIATLGLPDEFGQSGRCQELWDHYGLTSRAIVKTVLDKMRN